MARIIGVDYGKARTGLSVTDPLQIIVSVLDTVQTQHLWDFLVTYLEKEEVEKIVFGYPTHKDGNPTFLLKDIQAFINRLKKKYPILDMDFEDEFLTSSRAKEIIFQSGVKKKKRRSKELVDSISAVLILQQYLGHI